MNGIQTIIAEIDRQINQLPRDHGSELALKALTEIRSIADAQRDPDETKVSRFALYWYADEPGKVYLSNLFVPEDQRGKGEGSKTLETAIRAAVLLGAEWLYLRPASAEVVAWYLRRGFEPCNKDSVWLRRRIAPAKPRVTCRSCVYYERDCPFIRGKLIPYPNKVCASYVCGEI